MFLSFLDLEKFLTISSTLPSLPTTSLLLIADALGAKLHDLIIFNIEVSGAAICVKSQMTRR